jgi:hypothetical protein
MDSGLSPSGCPGMTRVWVSLSPNCHSGALAKQASPESITTTISRTFRTLTTFPTRRDRPWAAVIIVSRDQVRAGSGEPARRSSAFEFSIPVEIILPSLMQKPWALSRPCSAIELREEAGAAEAFEPTRRSATPAELHKRPGEPRPNWKNSPPETSLTPQTGPLPVSGSPYAQVVAAFAICEHRLNTVMVLRERRDNWRSFRWGSPMHKVLHSRQDQAKRTKAAEPRRRANQLRRICAMSDDKGH